jgi:hypothetical protein
MRRAGARGNIINERQRGAVLVHGGVFVRPSTGSVGPW